MSLIGRRVLVLEDNFVLALDLETQLRELGAVAVGPHADVTAARRDAEGVDAALLDVHVRGGTSLELAAELLMRGVPCIFVSGYGEIPALPRELAAVPRLLKPIAAAALRDALATLLA